MKRASARFVVAAIVLWANLGHAAPPPKIRVLVFQGANVTVSGLGHRMKRTAEGGFRGSGRNIGKRALIATDDEGLVMKGERIGERISITNRPQRYALGDREFRGELAVIWKGRGKLIVVDRLPLEDYLVGLIGSEMYPGWPIEAFKAQAVAARTYALHHSDGSSGAGGRDYDVTSGVLSQVYEGAHKEAFLAKRAVEATRGMVLMKGGAIFPAYYHSCCGGLTEHAHNVWEGAQGPPQVVDNYCELSPKRKWSARIPLAKFKNILRENGLDIGDISNISTRPEMDSPRVENVVVEHDGGIEIIKAARLRSMLGYSTIKSTWFEIDIKGDEALFEGKGYGHGVGMCQWGAKGMADHGAGFADILKFYYADADIMKVY